MNESDHIDDQMLGAFVDNQLDAGSRESVLRAAESDPEIRDQLYQLRRAKDLMKLGFDDARPPSDSGPLPVEGGRRRLSLAVAASFAALAISFGAGALGYYCNQQLDGGVIPAMASAGQQHSDRVILHIGESDLQQFAAALDYASEFLDQHKAGDRQIEVIANAGGLDLMRAGVSPFERKVVAMMRKHDNVQFIACANAIRNLHIQGIEPIIISDVQTDTTAVDRIVERLQAGWTYIKVDSLPET